MSITKKIEVKDDYIYVTVTRSSDEGQKEMARYQIKVENEGLVVDAVEHDGTKDDLVSLDMYEHIFEECPECGNSDVPGKVFNNNDPTSGQSHLCKTCTPPTVPSERPFGRDWFVPETPEEVV